ncbi:MAG: hypothetical protein DLM57_06790 [Pseudonocardiales bacterium]|nr:MAG: hypothetical protein DLM57_06790 [Pseudonocardiales bacterium]
MPGEPARGPVVRGEPPPPVNNAVRLMLVRAALGVLALIALIATKSTLKKEIFKKNSSYDPKKLDDALNAAIVVGVVIGIIFIVLYVLLALQVRKGKNWARIVTWVLAGLGVLGALVGFAQPEPALSRVLSLIGGIIDVAIIVLLAGKASSEYFRRAR